MKNFFAIPFLTLSSLGLFAGPAEAVTVTSGIYRQNSSSYCDLRAHFRGESVAIQLIDNRFTYCTERVSLHATWDRARKAYCTEMKADGRYCFEVPSDLLIRNSGRNYIFSQD